MKTPALILVILAGVRAIQAAGAQDTVETLINTMRETFGGLNTKRDQWFENYSSLKQLSQNDYLQLTQLLFVSKMAIPLVWHLYANQVKVQKAILPKLLRARSQTLPYHGTILAPAFPIFYVEATLVLHKHRNFQVEILRDSSEEIFHVNFDFENRRVSMGNRNQDGESNERVVLQDDEFPAISLHEPFSEERQRRIKIDSQQTNAGEVRKQTDFQCYWQENPNVCCSVSASIIRRSYDINLLNLGLITLEFIVPIQYQHQFMAQGKREESKNSRKTPPDVEMQAVTSTM